MKNNYFSPLTGLSEEAAVYVTAKQESGNNGEKPQGSATPDSNSSAYNNMGSVPCTNGILPVEKNLLNMHPKQWKTTKLQPMQADCFNNSLKNDVMNENYFYELAMREGCLTPDPCFQSIALDTTLMSEIKGLGLAPNQELYVHEMIKQAIQAVKEGFENPARKIDTLVVSGFSTWGQAAEFLSKSVMEQNEYPDIKKYWQPLTGLIKPLGKTGNVILTEFVKDSYFDDGSIMYPKGTVIGTIVRHPFPQVSTSYAYRELLDPENYSAPHYVLDFVNGKLHEAYPQYNLWCVALDFEFLDIYDLDKLPHMKRY